MTLGFPLYEHLSKLSEVALVKQMSQVPACRAVAAFPSCDFPVANHVTAPPKLLGGAVELIPKYFPVLKYYCYCTVEYLL